MTLSEIKEKLNEFQFINCGLRHEQVLLDTATILPVLGGAIDPPTYMRVNLCNIEDRRKRLGCAHSPSNDSFNRLLDQIPGDDDVIAQLQKQFNEVVLKIYVLDHQKGDLEKSIAEATDTRLTNDLSADEIQQEIASCISAHGSEIDSLRNINASIIDRIVEKLGA